MQKIPIISFLRRIKMPKGNSLLSPLNIGNTNDLGPIGGEIGKAIAAIEGATLQE